MLPIDLNWAIFGRHKKITAELFFSCRWTGYLSTQTINSFIFNEILLLLLYEESSDSFCSSACPVFILCISPTFSYPHLLPNKHVTKGLPNFSSSFLFSQFLIPSFLTPFSFLSFPDTFPPPTFSLCPVVYKISLPSSIKSSNTYCCISFLTCPPSFPFHIIIVYLPSSLLQVVTVSQSFICSSCSILFLYLLSITW